ncbi:hypothetical protein [Castellaniella defragrans]|uniref:hypothetical protein n=1 Tax=Castellaniella defragrans TaxID=75697 RepID=UPI0023F26E51|nr:hypothetical protein [Castellaniella defragrans]
MLEADDARFLTEVGMLAAGCGDVPHADTIFNALRRLRPDRAYPLIGLAVARLNAGRAAEAARLLQDAGLADPEERAVAQAWCGLALQLAGRGAESRRALVEAAALPGDGGVLARRMLGLAVELPNDDA